MRLDCSWSMSIAGLTAQEIYLPPQSLFLHSSQCHSMSRAKSSWKYDHDLDNFYFSVDASVNCNVQSRQQVPSFLAADKQRVHSLHSPGAQPLPPKKSRPAQLCISSTYVPHTPSPIDDDQVVPGLQRLSVSDHVSPPQTPSRAAKPLPPIPCSVDLSPDQTVESDVEFFTGDESRCLVSDSCLKPSHFRYGMHSRRSLRDCGQINYAYFEGPVPQQSKQEQQLKKKHEQESQERLLPQQREPEQHEEHQRQHKTTCVRQQERAQRKLRRSHSGPAGSYNKPSALRFSCHHRNTQDLDKPEVPPRVPIPPRPAKTGDCRRWSAEVAAGTCSDDDRPPKVPPREPLSSSMPHAQSPKSLPIYFNGIMPPTQSFAPDPKYVSRGLQSPNTEGSPCILPIMENGRKASTTHYFLLPQRPAYLDKHEKYFVDSASSQRTEMSGSSLDWSCDSKKKMHSDLV